MPSDEQDVLDAARNAGFFRAADYWKAEHLAGNAEIERLRAEVLRLTAENKVAAKAAYERAADKCRRHADSARGAANVGAGIDLFAARYIDGCTECESAISAMGESDE